MKKWLTCLLALMMLASLAACADECDHLYIIGGVKDEVKTLADKPELYVRLEVICLYCTLEDDIAVYGRVYTLEELLKQGHTLIAPESDDRTEEQLACKEHHYYRHGRSVEHIPGTNEYFCVHCYHTIRTNVPLTAQ